MPLSGGFLFYEVNNMDYIVKMDVSMPLSGGFLFYLYGKLNDSGKELIVSMPLSGGFLFYEIDKVLKKL